MFLDWPFQGSLSVHEQRHLAWMFWASGCSDFDPRNYKHQTNNEVNTFSVRWLHLHACARLSVLCVVLHTILDLFMDILGMWSYNDGSDALEYISRDLEKDVDKSAVFFIHFNII